MADSDIAMNQFKMVTTAPYIYVELADGSQGKIKKSDLADILFNQVGLYSQNVRKVKSVASGEILNLGIRGGLVVFSTDAFQTQCVALYSCTSTRVELLNDATAVWILGNRNTVNEGRMVIFREESTNSCFIKSNWNVSITLFYQIIAGTW